MIGIIYKFTILAKVKYFGHKPFYVGQHWEKRSVEDFLKRETVNYQGSGITWLKCFNKLKKQCPKIWVKLVKREVLYASETVNQNGLDALEKHYIKKEKAHYSYRKGGCNVLWGTANRFGSGSPSKDPLVAKKIGDKAREYWKKPGVREYYSKLFSDGRYNGENNPFYGKKHTKETIAKIKKTTLDRYGTLNLWTDETKKKVSKIIKEKYQKGEIINPMLRKHHTPEAKKKISNAVSGENNPMHGVHLTGDKHWNYGKHWDEEHKRHQSEVLKRKYASGELVSPFKGKHHTEENKRKNSECMKGRYVGKNNPFYGRKHTEETKQKIRLARLKTRLIMKNN